MKLSSTYHYQDNNTYLNKSKDTHKIKINKKI